MDRFVGEIDRAIVISLLTCPIVDFQLSISEIQNTIGILLKIRLTQNFTQNSEILKYSVFFYSK